jgi:hypothetical protein
MPPAAEKAHIQPSTPARRGSRRVLFFTIVATSADTAPVVYQRSFAGLGLLVSDGLRLGGHHQ